MCPTSDRNPAPSRPLGGESPRPAGVRLMVDFASGRIIGADRPSPAGTRQAGPAAPRGGVEPPSLDAA